MSSIPKCKPARDKAFLQWAHRELRSGLCCLCHQRPWEQLHHFGDNGGMGLKPSDYLVCRVCRSCHDTYAFKGRRWSWTEQTERVIAMAHMQRDALVILEAYLLYQQQRADDPTIADLRRALAGGQAVGCAIEEFDQWWATEGFLAAPADLRAWVLRWADRRAAAILDEFHEGDYGTNQD